MNEYKRLFACKGIEAYFERKIQNGQGCALLKNNKKRAQTVMEIALPEMIAEICLVDEIHQTFGSKKMKFTFTSDCLSRFSRLYQMVRTANKEKIVQQILRISDYFLFNKKIMKRFNITDPM